MNEIEQYQSYATILEACIGRLQSLETDWKNGVLPDPLFHRKFQEALRDKDVKTNRLADEVTG